MTQFVKSLDRESLAFKHLAVIFPRISKEKIKAGVFNGPQVDQLASNNDFLQKLTDDQKIAFLAMIDVIRNFLGNRRADNYEEIVDKMIRAFHTINVNMSLKVHFLANHLDFFPENMGYFSDQHGERFHQDIAYMEQHFKGKNATHLLGNYCWTLVRDKPEEAHKRKR